MLLLLLACAGSTSDDTAATDDTGATGEGAYSLDTCGGSVDEALGAPWSWFRCATVTVTDADVTVRSSDLPPHPSPYYEADDPNWVEFDDRGGEWHQNPNTLSAQDLTVRIPLDPTPKGIVVTEDMVDRSATTSDDEYHGGSQGVGPDGVAFFAGFAGPGDDISVEEYTFDLYEGHPQESGVYHHHGSNPAALAVMVANGLATSTVPGEAEVELYGIMCDGTVVIGCTELDGGTPTDDLDAQNGHVTDIVGPDGTTLFTSRYHVHACSALGDWLAPEIQYYDDGTCL